MKNKKIKRKYLLSSAALTILILIQLIQSTQVQTKTLSASHIDSDSSANFASITGGSTLWNINYSASWSDLQTFLPSGKMSGTAVWVKLVPPSKSPLYSEPYKNDYIRWAQEIARLSLRYSNLKGYSIENLQDNINSGNLTQNYIENMKAAGLAINSKLEFIQIDTTPPNAPMNLSAQLLNINVNPNLPQELAYKTNNVWQGWTIQSVANKQRVSIVANPNISSLNLSPSVGRIRIYKNDDYSAVANGLPRSELMKYPGFNLDYGNIYAIEWDDYLDPFFVCDTVIGSNNHVYLAQVKASGQDAASLVLTMNGAQYVYTQYVYLAEGSYYNKTTFGNIEQNKGKWQHWQLKFLVDSTSNAWSVLRHNGTVVDSNKARVFPRTNNPNFYFKIGLYRNDWNTYPTKADSIIRYIDNVKLSKITPTFSTATPTDFGVTNGNTSDSIAHYIDLKWTNPTDKDHDSCYIFRSEVNDPETANKVAILSKAITNYRDILTKPNVFYYWIRAKDKNGNLSIFSSVAYDNKSIFVK